ncbi:hypothetical protein [Streptomyces sp. XY332]|uniref:hypothetical protein n=1 Tax=Streptomyces sp. XY332 TaxID=1415561 RepID=UPI0006B17985|nr:hypothetical protein [Streptomyces sp. XY332]KOY56194.1 hypothetical protein ADK59_20560 [Streptomyces sp. XY332]
MRIRTAAVALAGALALTLPVGAQAFADDGQSFNYVFLKDGESQQAQISDLTEGTCHELAVTDGAVQEIANDSDMVALLFDNATCSGEPVVAAGPGEKVGDIKAVAVAFERAERAEPAEPAEHSEHADGAVMPGSDEDEDEDLFTRIFSAKG